MNKSFFLQQLSIVALAISLVFVTGFVYAETVTENFDGDSLDTSLWQPLVMGVGDISQAAGRFEAIIPSTDTGAVFVAGIRLQKVIAGDFDISVDYELLSPMPKTEGEPLAGIILEDFFYDVLFVGRSINNNTADPPVDAYVADVGGGEFQINLSDVSGSLRFERVGNLLSAYYRSGSDTEWQLITSAVNTNESFSLIGIGVGSEGPTTISAAFDNFYLEADQILPFPETVNVSDYWPLDPGVVCSRTTVGERRISPGTWESAQFKNSMLGEITVPYENGDVTGNAACDGDFLSVRVYEDYQMKSIMEDNNYQSSSCGFKEPPPGIGFLTDGDIFFESDFARFQKGNLSTCMEGGGGNEFLVKIQDVTVGGTYYEKSVVLWELSDFQCGEEGQPSCDSYIAPESHSKYAEWGLNFPTESEQADILRIGKISHGGFMILGKGEGWIVRGLFDLEKDEFGEFKLNLTAYLELASISCTEPEINLVDVPGSRYVIASGISGGKVVGWYYNPELGVATGFAFDNGIRTDLNDPTFGFPANTYASDINIHGEIVGSTTTGLFAPQHGFFYKDGVFHNIRVQDGSPTSIRGINDLGDMVGDYCAENCDDMNPFNDVWRSFRLKKLSEGSYDFAEIMHEGYTKTTVEDINIHGEVVGYYFNSSLDIHGFVWNETDVDPFTEIIIEGASIVPVYGINNHGDMVGIYQLPSGDQHGFMITASGEQTDIDIPCEQVTSPQGIDDEGNIVGLSFCSDFPYGFKLTPKSTSDSVEDLMEFIEILDIPEGTQESLESKIDNALDALNSDNSDNRQDFVNKMQAFMNSVEAQRGKKLTDIEADRLIEWAMEILGEL